MGVASPRTSPLTKMINRGSSLYLPEMITFKRLVKPLWDKALQR